MTTYSVGIVQRVWEETTVVIEASSKEEAERLAMERVEAGSVEWRFLECDDDMAREVVSVTAYTGT